MTDEPLAPRSASEAQYVAARRVLLDALFALAPHRNAFILAGAQALYLRANDADLSTTVAPYTTDGDLALDPSGLRDDPQLEAVMTRAGFVLLPRSADHVEPGIWIATTEVGGDKFTVPIDLIVPETIAPAGGRRGARLGVHGDRAARRAIGLEAALVDNGEMEIAAFEPGDDRVATFRVAGTSALFVAKLHKLHDRVSRGRLSRINDKDAADVVRMMRVVSMRETVATFRGLLADDRSAAVTDSALGFLDELFGRPGREGIRMASDALRLALRAEEIEGLALAFVSALIAELR